MRVYHIITAPSGSPGNIMSTGSTSTSITLTWDRLSCEERNGEITGYSIQYGITSFTATDTVTGTSPSDRTFTASELLPLTTYRFRIRAVNNGGLVGPYSDTVTFQTSIPTGEGKKQFVHTYIHMSCILNFAEVTLVHNNELLANQSIVNLGDIDSGNSQLLCLANTPRCCRGRDGARGFWYFPDGTAIPGSNVGGALIRNRVFGLISLARSSSTGVMTGLFRCEIADTMGMVLVGIYRSGEGELVILKELLFIIVHYL